jgi:hypothetical protein
MDYTVTLTEAENKTMEYIAADPQDWIDNVVHNRVRKGIEEICTLYTNYKLDRGELITAATRDEMVIAAFEEGVVKTGAQRSIEAEAAASQLPA